MEIVHTFCQHCHMGCPLSIKVENGNIASISGYSCEKGQYAAEVIYHPDRLTYPLKRVGKRGEGKWERISWNNALETMADRFGQIKEKYGAETIAVFHACGHKLAAVDASILLGRVIGTPQLIGCTYTCTYPSAIADWFTFGTELYGDIGAQYDQSKCVIIWGASLRHCRPPHDDDTNRARAKGAKLIVIDPRPPHEVVSDKPGLSPALWLRVRPGTDAALAMGMINTVINEGLYDKDFVDKWCFGFEELKEKAQEYPLEKVAEITWIPKETIVEAARLWATTKPACLMTRCGVGAQQVNATQTSRAIACLAAILGNIDVKGGNLITDEMGGFIGSRWMLGYHLGSIPVELEEKRAGFNDFPFFCGKRGMFEDFPDVISYAINPPVFEAMAKGDMKALYLAGSNVIVNEGDSRQSWEALMNADFSVAADIFMNPTTELVDLVLPVVHFLEQDGVPMRPWRRMGTAHQNYIMAPRKVVEPPRECWDDRKIIIELAKRMNVDIPWKTVAELGNWHFQDSGLTYDDVLNSPGQMVSFGIRYKKHEDEGFKFNTPSGKVELYSTVLKNHGQDPLPSFKEPTESPYNTPDLYKNYPFISINYRHRAYTHTEFRQISSLRKLYPDFLIEINPETAAEFGIEDGDEMYVERHGFDDKVYGKAKLIPELHPKVVGCLCLWWYPEDTGPEYGCFKSNINSIISTKAPYDPVGGTPNLRAILCRIGKSNPGVKK